MLVQIAAVLGYAAGMAYATWIAPHEARWPSVVLLHGAAVLGYLVGLRRVR